MKIAILGTRGIPNNYGGFEQFAEYLSCGLVERGHEVIVYNPHFHPYRLSEYKGVRIVQKYSPENYLGAAANFIYDYLCLKDALDMQCDIILECGYHSNAPSYYLIGKDSSSVVVTNMDGLEWKRSKWNNLTRKLIKSLEKLAVSKSHVLVSDNLGIQEYYLQEYNKESYFIPYGAICAGSFDEKILENYQLFKKNYFLLIARLEPENNIETILDGFCLSKCEIPFIVVGGVNSNYGKFLIDKYKGENIVFLGGIYKLHDLNNIRKFARAYFHGHSVGGTNPSLLEAMGSDSNIIAHDNKFNRSVLAENALYFKNKEEIRDIITKQSYLEGEECRISRNRKLITENYSWENIITKYETLFSSVLKTPKNGY